jgi:uncharacterized protein YjiS (DUF1127 family)
VGTRGVDLAAVSEAMEDPAALGKGAVAEAWRQTRRSRHARRGLDGGPDSSLRGSGGGPDGFQLARTVQAWRRSRSGRGSGREIVVRVRV